MIPSSPAHSLQYINANMQTMEMLRNLHEWMIARRKEIDSGELKHESPLITLRKGIRRVLRLMKEEKIIPLHPNPFNEEFQTRLKVNLDVKKATEHDINLLKQQLKELDKIYNEIKSGGFYDMGG